MSDVLYPIGQIERLDVTLNTRTIKDDFESGAVNTRRLWSAQNVKRKFKVKHAPLDPTTFRWLQSFFSARDGEYDPFWFRDNVNRGGNSKVLLSDPFPISMAGERVYRPELTFEEVSPTRLLPDYFEVFNAAQGPSLLGFYDPNRQIYISHQALISGESSAPNRSLYTSLGYTITDWDLYEQTYGYVLITDPTYGEAAPQFDGYYYLGTNWQRSAATLSLGATQPAMTIFGIMKNDGIAAKQVAAAVGAVGAGKALGLVLAADNYYEPWVGGTEVWTNARFHNSPSNTWRSVAVVWASGSNDAKLYVNGALIGTDTVTRSYVAGYASMGASGTGTLIAQDVTRQSNILFDKRAMTITQIKALHNLFAYQYGLTPL